MSYHNYKEKGTKENMSGHNPNDGENQTHYSGNAEGGRTASVIDSAGVGDGLSHVGGIEVKNAENVCPNQRPKGRTDSSGSFKIGY